MVSTAREPSLRDRAQPLRMHRRVPTLAEAFDPRRNSLAVIRLGLALVVALAHGLSTGYGYQPHLGRTPVADAAVDAFFVLSGFLVTRSFLDLRSVGRYTWHRALRIMPGFWACLVVTALVLAPLAALLLGRDPGSVLTADEDPAWRYPLVNAALPLVQFGIADLATPSGRDTLDGALWTLQYEAFCYGAVAVLGVVGLLRRRRGLLLLCGLVWAAVLVEAAGGIPVDVPVLENRSLLRFLLVFLLGAAGWVLADRIRIAGSWAIAAASLVGAAMFLPDHRVVAAVPFAYLCLYAVVRLPFRVNPRWDLSYGVYVYHFPVQFLLAVAGAAAWGAPAFVLASIALTVPLAALSWWAVEGPALRLKGIRAPFRTRSADAAVAS